MTNKGKLFTFQAVCSATSFQMAIKGKIEGLAAGCYFATVHQTGRFFSSKAV